MGNGRRRSILGAVLLGAAVLSGPGITRADDASSRPPPPPPAIEPKAVALLKSCGDRLASAGTMSFTAVTTYESPAKNGQPLYYTQLYDVLVQRPNRLRVLMPADGPPSELYFDGRTVTAFAPAEGLAAVAAQPGTLDDLVVDLYQKAAIFYPFEDAIVADPYAAMTKGMVSAFVVGQSHVVGGTTTFIIATASEDAQAVIWIGADDRLPREVRVVRPKEPGSPHYQLTFSDWRLNLPVSPDAFTSDRAARAPRMTFARPDGPPPDAPKPPRP